MKLGVIVLFLLVRDSGFADEIALRFEQANQLYRNGEFERAAKFYEEILSHDYESPELYYNLGNAYYKLNNLAAAILNYERARRLAPHDEDVDHNLRLAQLRVVDKIDPLPQLFFVEWWNSVVNSFSTDHWATIALVSLWIAAMSGAVFIVGRFFLRRIAAVTLVAAGVVCIVSFVSALNRNAIENEQTAIVFSSSVSVKSAPDRQSTDLFILHEGVKVELLDSVGNWRKIRLADGKVGWLPVESVERI